MAKITTTKIALLLLLALCLGYSSTLYAAQHDVDDEKEQSADNKLKQQEIRIIKRLNAQKRSFIVKPFQLPKKGDHFTGRQQKQTSMAAFFAAKRKKPCAFQVITGMGGTGKTSLALHYAHACAKEAKWVHHRYDAILWLYAETGLGSQFHETAKVWGKDCKTAQEAVKFVYMTLQKKNRTLLVFDNAEPSQEIAPYLPPKDQKGLLDILITTRNPALDLPRYSKSTYITLDVFTREESRAYTQKVLGHKQHSQQDMDALCDSVGDLPVALSYALQYIKKEKYTLAKYPAHFVENQLRLGTQMQASPLVASFLLPVLTLKKKHPIIEPLLVTAAHLAPKRIPITAVSTAIDKIDTQKALFCFHEYGLLTLAEDYETFDIHRLVQQVFREWHLAKSGPTGVHTLLKDWMTDFQPLLEKGRPKGGSSTDIQYFKDTQRGRLWIGKCNINAFIGAHNDEEYREALGLAIYRFFGIVTPDFAVSVQPVAPSVYKEFPPGSSAQGYRIKANRPCIHIMTQFLDGFSTCGEAFKKDAHDEHKDEEKENQKAPAVTYNDSPFMRAYKQAAKAKKSFHLAKNGKKYPLQGLGSMLALANFIYDMDCIGKSGGNLGYLIKGNHAQVVKIDPGCAFSFLENHTNKKFHHNPMDRKTFFGTDESATLGYDQLTPVDQQDFAAMAKRILQTPRKTLKQLIYGVVVPGGWQQKMADKLLDHLIARKSLLLAAFALEIDDNLRQEITDAKHRLVGTLVQQKGAQKQAKEQIQAYKKTLKEIRAWEAKVAANRLIKQKEPKNNQAQKPASVKEPFQLPNNARGDLFTGRQQERAAMAAFFGTKRKNACAFQAITGVGGLGKTYLALHYAHACADRAQWIPQRYDAILWLYAEAGLESQFHELAQAWGKKDCKNTQEAVEFVYMALQQQNRTLLVFDNVEQRQEVAPYLPPKHQKGLLDILITTRNPALNFLHYGKPTYITLAAFTKEENRLYIQKVLGNKGQSQQAMNVLWETVSGLPLALNHALQYIAKGKCTLAKYPARFAEHQLRLGTQLQASPVVTSVLLSVLTLREAHPLIEPLLVTAAYLAPNNIPKSAIRAIIGKKKVNQLSKALVMLHKYGLLILASGGDTFGFHPLVQQVLREWYLSKRGQVGHEALLALWMGYFYKNLKYDARDLAAIYQINPLIPHACAIADAEATSEAIEKLQAELYFEIGGHQCFDVGHYDRAKQCYEKALKIETQHYGAHHPETAKTIANLGSVLSNLGDYAEAKKYLQRALKIDIKRYGDSHPQTAKMVNNLALVLRNLGDYAQAKTYLQKALKIQEKNYGTDHPTTAIAMGNLGNVLVDLGDYAEAQQYLEKALKITVRHYGANHPTTASIIANLAGTLRNLGNYALAKQYYKKALKIEEKHYGADHIATASTMGNLAGVLRNLGDYASAKQCYKKALKIKEKHYGAHHPTTAITIANLGSVLYHLGDYAQAKTYLQKSLKINEKHYGADHPQTVSIIESLGNVLRNLGDYALAKQYFQKALKINGKHYGADHPNTARTIGNLGGVLKNLGDYAQARKYYEKALKINEKHYGPTHPETAKTIENLGIVLINLGDYAEAKTYFQKAIKIKEKHYGEDHPTTASTIGNLGTVLGNLGDYAQAKQCLQKALKIKEKHYGADNPETARTIGNLGTVLGNLGDYPQAKQCLQKALKIEEKHYGPDHPETAKTIASLGNVLLRLGDYAQAKQYYEKALKIAEQHYGVDHPHTATMMNNLGGVLLSLGDYAEAKQYYQKALKINTQHYGADHPETARTIGNLGTVLSSQGDYAQAKTYLQKALKIKEKHYVADHPETARTMGNLGNLCKNLGQYEKAREYYEKTLAIFTRHYGPNHAMTKKAKGHLTDLEEVAAKSLLKSLLGNSLNEEDEEKGDDKKDQKQPKDEKISLQDLLKLFAMLNINQKQSISPLGNSLNEEDEEKGDDKKDQKQPKDDNIPLKEVKLPPDNPNKIYKLHKRPKDDVSDGEKDADAAPPNTLVDDDTISLDIVAAHFNNNSTFAAWLEYMHHNACDTDVLLYTVQDKIDDNILYDGFKGDKNILLEVTNFIEKKEKTKPEAKKTKKHAESTLDNPLNQVTGKPNTPYKVHKQPKDASGPDKKENDTDGNKEIASSKQPLMWGQIDQLHHQLQPNEEKEDENQDDDVFDID